jgi:beta-lactamase class A
MSATMTRRAAVAGLIVLPPLVAGVAEAAGEDAGPRLAALEKSRGGRLGVAAWDGASGRRILHRADERFPLLSTFKFLAAAHVLARVDRGEERLDRRVPVRKEDLVTWAPVTEKHVGGEMALGDICHAAITVSDNSAGNLMLASFGGPAALTAFARSLGDEVTRLDRIETALNEAKAGDPRDTTSPAAMLADMRRLLLGDVLSATSRDQLASWLAASTTGGKRLRAAFPAEWRVGDKTGTGSNGAANDIAIAWRPGREPLLVAVYYTESNNELAGLNDVIAEAGRIVARSLDRAATD